MNATWKQADVFPIIARIIDNAHANNQRFITHDEITEGLLADAKGARIIYEAQQQQDEKQSLEWLAHNMVAWFSKSISDGQSNWNRSFDRTSIDGKWAYKPRVENADALGN